MFQVYDKKYNCSGCTACASICPVSAICMKPDEKGFLYPYVDQLVCIHCNKCINTCPIRNKQLQIAGSDVESELACRCFAMRLLDEEKLSKSTSGGAACGFAEAVIEAGGSVYGAAYGVDNNVIYIRVDSADALWKLQGTKYVQSDVRGVFCYVKADLEANRQVLFFGTACQIEGLRAFLGREYKNLITVDAICFGVPSPMLWKKFLTEEYENYSECSFNMRDKISGWKDSSFTIEKNGQRIGQCKRDDVSFLRAFNRAYGLRDSCFSCAFKKSVHDADLTIGDCWGIDKLVREGSTDNSGTNMVFANTAKGLEMIKNVWNNFWIEELPLIPAIKENMMLVKSVEHPKYETEFWEDIIHNPFKNVIYKYAPRDSVTLKLKKKLYRIKQAVMEKRSKEEV